MESGSGCCGRSSGLLKMGEAAFVILKLRSVASLLVGVVLDRRLNSFHVGLHIGYAII